MLRLCSFWFEKKNDDIKLYKIITTHIEAKNQKPGHNIMTITRCVKVYHINDNLLNLFELVSINSEHKTGFYVCLEVTQAICKQVLLIYSKGCTVTLFNTCQRCLRMLPSHRWNTDNFVDMLQIFYSYIWLYMYIFSYKYYFQHFLMAFNVVTHSGANRKMWRWHVTK